MNLKRELFNIENRLSFELFDISMRNDNKRHTTQLIDFRSSSFRMSL